MNRAVNTGAHITGQVASKYMSLSLGRVKLLMLQSGIASLESLQNIIFDQPSAGALGWIDYAGHHVPVYSFTERLGIEHSLSDGKTICAILTDGDCFIAIMCKEVTPFGRDIIRVQPLPECMQSSPCPIESLCLYRYGDRREIKYTVSVESIRKFIEKCEN